MIKEERKIEGLKWNEEKNHEDIKKKLESGDFQQKVGSPGCPNPRLNGGRLLPPLMCPPSHCS